MPTPLVLPFPSLNTEDFTTPQQLSQFDQNYSVLLGGINDAARGWVNYGTDTGTVNNYIVTLPSPPLAYSIGFTLMFNPVNTNTGAATINVNGLGTQAIKRSNGFGAQPGDLIAGVLVSLVYNGGNFVLMGINAFDTGTIKLFGYGGVAPGWVDCSGQAISRTVYAQLFGLIGTLYGAGDGSTTFNVPNFLGNRYPVHTASLGTTGGATTHTMTLAELVAHTHTTIDPGHTHTGATTGVLARTDVTIGGSSQALNTVTGSANNPSLSIGLSPTLLGIAPAGSGAAFSIQNPFLGVLYRIKV